MLYHSAYSAVPSSSRSWVGNSFPPFVPLQHHTSQIALISSEVCREPPQNNNKGKQTKTNRTRTQHHKIHWWLQICLQMSMGTLEALGAPNQLQVWWYLLLATYSFLVFFLSWSVAQTKHVLICLHKTAWMNAQRDGSKRQHRKRVKSGRKRMSHTHSESVSKGDCKLSSLVFLCDSVRLKKFGKKAEQNTVLHLRN